VFALNALPLVVLWADAAPPAGGGGSIISMMPLFAGMLLLFWFLLIQPQRKEQAHRKSMLASIKKNDRVITNSGIFGVVTNVAAETDEITIKVDEANNTKLRMTLSSIARKVGESDQENKS